MCMCADLRVVCAVGRPPPPLGLPLLPHLKHRDVILPVDLVGWGMEPATLAHVLVQDAAALHVTQAELAQVQFGQSGARVI